jgi:hypothetical protein
MSKAISEHKQACETSDNYSSLPTRAILHMAALRNRQESYLSPTIQSELELARDLFLTNDTDSIVVKGHIHFLSSVPFTLVFYSENRLRFYIDFRKAVKNICMLHIDVTGNIEKLGRGSIKPYHYTTSPLYNSN